MLFLREERKLKNTKANFKQKLCNVIRDLVTCDNFTYRWESSDLGNHF